jgi:hypothetical protein
VGLTLHPAANGEVHTVFSRTFVHDRASIRRDVPNAVGADSARAARRATRADAPGPPAAVPVLQVLRQRAGRGPVGDAARRRLHAGAAAAAEADHEEDAPGDEDGDVVEEVRVGASVFCKTFEPPGFKQV